MAIRHLKNHWAFILCVVYTSLAAEMRVGHLGCLKAHKTKILSQTVKKKGISAVCEQEGIAMNFLCAIEQ